MYFISVNTAYLRGYFSGFLRGKKYKSALLGWHKWICIQLVIGEELGPDGILESEPTVFKIQF